MEPAQASGGEEEEVAAVPAAGGWQFKLGVSGDGLVAASMTPPRERRVGDAPEAPAAHAQPHGACTHDSGSALALYSLRNRSCHQYNGGR